METLPKLPVQPLLPVQSQFPPPLTIETPLPSNPNRRNWLILLAIAIIAIFLLILSFVVWQIYQSSNQAGISPTQDANGWEEYTSQKCKYQISYPPTWYVYTDAEQEDLATVLITSSLVQSETVSINEARVQIGCSSFDSSLTPKIVVDDLNTRYQGKDFNISLIQQTIIGGKIAYYQTISSNQTGLLKEYYIFPTNNRVIIVNIVSLDSSQIDIAETVLEKIIFLD